MDGKVGSTASLNGILFFKYFENGFTVQQFVLNFKKAKTLFNASNYGTRVSLRDCDAGDEAQAFLHPNLQRIVAVWICINI